MLAPAPQEPKTTPGSEVTAVLLREHAWILEALHPLERAAAKLGAGQSVDVQQLQELLAFLHDFGDRCHHAKEEDVLFPVLQEAGVAEAGTPLGPVTAQHEQARRLMHSLQQHAAAVGRDKDARDHFVQAALGYVAMVRDHITLESEVLFPLAEELLGDDTSKIVSAFSLYEFHAVGEDAAPRFRAKLDDLVRLFAD